MNDLIKDDITEKIFKNFEESENSRLKEIEEYTTNKFSLTEGLKSGLKETLVKRKEMKLEKDEILKERDLLKMKQNSKKETEKKLQDIILDLIDINTAISVLKEVMLTGFQSDLIEKAFNCINLKKEEQYKNDIKKMTSKDKANALKILEEIKGLNLKISEDIMKKLTDIAGII